jgi:hypothetical protein
LTEAVLFQSFACEPQGELTRPGSDAQPTEMARHYPRIIKRAVFVGPVPDKDAWGRIRGCDGRYRRCPFWIGFKPDIAPDRRSARARAWQPVSDQAARTVLRNLPTWLFKRSLSPASDCAADSTWPDAELVSLDP